VSTEPVGYTLTPLSARPAPTALSGSICLLGTLDTIQPGAPSTLQQYPYGRSGVSRRVRDAGLGVPGAETLTLATLDQWMAAGSKRRQDAILTAYDLCWIPHGGRCRRRTRPTPGCDSPTESGWVFCSTSRTSSLERGRRSTAWRAGSVHDRCWEPLTPYRPAAISTYSSSSLHDWDDDQAVAILQNRVLGHDRARSWLAIDRAPRRRTRPQRRYTMDPSTCWSRSQGSERTELEFRSLYDRAGLRLMRVPENGKRRKPHRRCTCAEQPCSGAS